MNGGYYQWYDDRELARTSMRRRLKISLCAIVVFVLVTFLFGVISSYKAGLVYYFLGVNYGDVYIFDRICDIVLYTYQLVFPAAMYLLIRRIPFKSCFDFSRVSRIREKVTPFTVLRYFFIAFTISCSFSYIISFFTESIGLDSSGFSLPTASTPVEFVFDILSIAVLPALFEEFVYRGVILAELLPYGKSFAIVTSAMIFASVHGSITQIAYAFVSGLIFAFIAVKTGSLTTGIVLHFLNNAFSCIVDYCLINYPGVVTELVIGAVSTVIVLLGLVGTAYLIGNRRFELHEDSEEQLLSVSDSFKELRSPLMLCFYALVFAETLISYF